jgi:hypothetical protein
MGRLTQIQLTIFMEIMQIQAVLNINTVSVLICVTYIRDGQLSYLNYTHSDTACIDSTVSEV